MNILLTGASSFVGFWFASKLAEAGHRVVTPLRGAPGDYEGASAERLRRLSISADVVTDCSFGSPAFLALVGEREFEVLCHLASDARDSHSGDFDVAAALAADTLNLRRILPLMRERGLKAVVATGSVEEPGEGAGVSPPRAFSPYGLARSFSFETLRYWGDLAGVAVSKFVVAEAFGPFEEPRFVDFVLRCWAEGQTAEIRAPERLRDHIHVDLLALAFAAFVAEAAKGGPARRAAPCGYLETQAAFAERLARELGPRLGLEGRVQRLTRLDAGEPAPRFNTEVVDGLALGWREDLAWDALASYYRRKGYVGAATKPAAPRALELRGAIDIATHSLVTGWVTDKLGANPRFARVSVDGEELGAIRADAFRRDLKELDISDGRSGYRFVFPRPLDIYKTHVVRVDDRDSGALFGPAPVVLKRLVGDSDSPFGAPGETTVVNLGTAIYDAEGISLVLEAFGRAAGFTRLEVDGAEVERVDTVPIDRPYYVAAALPATRFSVRIRPRAGASTIRLGFAEAGALDAADQLLCENAAPAHLPEYIEGVSTENMERVSGPGAKAGGFAATGLSTARRLDGLARLHFGRGLAECGRCLDWGAGAGRVAMPMLNLVAPGIALTAADVDTFNVDFATAHCRGIDFVAAPFMPPMPFPDAAFGAIYGVSVFTHLTEAAQFAWLSELRRLVPAGAPVIVSVHNDYAALTTAESFPELIDDMVVRGFSDRMFDHNLGPKLREAGYYRATFHTHRYLREHWTREFEIAKIYPFGNGATQDFVVLRAK